jgi:NAD(P)-dependent dehydrogenase (short-subunit alcohol dehydrogenase family)
MNNPLDFSGKVALITGAAAGMGLATTKGEVGAPVVLADFKGRRGKDGGAEVGRRRARLDSRIGRKLDHRLRVAAEAGRLILISARSRHV